MELSFNTVCVNLIYTHPAAGRPVFLVSKFQNSNGNLNAPGWATQRDDRI